MQINDLCQCPIRAFFNFYIDVEIEEGGRIFCVNALYGPFLISTKNNYWNFWKHEQVSMPYTGLF